MKNSRKLILIVLLALLLVVAITVAACTPDDPAHQHTFAQEWSSNQSEHWHAATCGHKVTSDRAAHNFGTDDVCDTCGYTKGQGGSDPTHQHTFAEQWSISDAEHWHAATCNHDVTADNAAHTLVNNVCSVCGYQNNVNWDDFTFEQSDDGYVLTKYNGTDAHVNIPDTYNDLSVVGIGEKAFSRCESLVSVTIPNSVKFIDGNRDEENSAFEECYNLTTVNFGSNSQLESIGYHAFFACYSLTSITIPDSVTSIGYDAFGGCENLTTVNFGANSQLESIGDYAFGGCYSLTSITIPDSVISIGEVAFLYCFSAVIYCEAPEQPSGWNSDWNVVDDKNSCRPVVWNYKQSNIADDGYVYDIVDGIRYGFKDNQAKVCGNNYSGDVTIPSTVEYQGKDYIVKSISDGAIACCFDLTSVVIPDGITDIGVYAFFGGDNLTSITIPNSVKTIGEGAFNSCKNLQNIYYDGTIADWCGITFNDSDSNPMYCAENFYIKKNGAWQEVAEIEIPDGVTEIGNYQFYGFDNLVSVTIPDGVTSIGDGAFSDCDCLAYITIPDSVTSIGDNAFSGCDCLAYITIPDSVTSIGSMAFRFCENLVTVNFGANSKLESLAEEVFVESGLTSITIPASVTSIGDWAFASCENLATVNFGANSKLESIGNNAFSECDNLATVNFGANSELKSIGNNAFSECDNLVTVNFGANSKLESLAEEVFVESGLTSITIPASVTSIGDGAFGGCENLVTVNFGANSKLESMGDTAFWYCYNLTSIFIPKSVINFGGDVFYNCDNLTIYCEAATKPSGWSSDWNRSGYSSFCPVVWGATRQDAEQH